MNKGRIVQVMGPVVDVVFENGDLPFIKDALEVENNGKKCIMEVAQHLGNNEVRCLMLAASEGLCKDMEVTATGAGIQVAHSSVRIPVLSYPVLLMPSFLSRGHFPHGNALRLL